MKRDETYEKAIVGMPETRCGRTDMNTFLPEPATVGRVTSDVIRYVYVDGDEEETVVIGKRADEVAYAAARYISEQKEATR